MQSCSRPGSSRKPRLVKPMVRSETLLTAIVTLSLGRPHFSCKEARPEGLAGTELPDSYTYSRVYLDKRGKEGRMRGKTKSREKRVRECEGRNKRSKSSGSREQGKEDLKRSRTDKESRCIAGLSWGRMRSLFERENKGVDVIYGSGFELDLPDVVIGELDTGTEA